MSTSGKNTDLLVAMSGLAVMFSTDDGVSQLIDGTQGLMELRAAYDKLRDESPEERSSALADMLRGISNLRTTLDELEVYMSEKLS